MLPRLGLGLSTNLSARDPTDPWELHAAHPGLFDFVEYSAPLSVDEARAAAPRFAALEAALPELPAIFHPVHLNLWGPELESDERLAQLAAHLSAVCSPWVGNDVAWWHHRGTPFPGYLYVSPPLDERGVEEAAVHALAAQARLPVPLLLENPASMAIGGPMHVLDFMARLHARTGLGLLLDLGHLLAEQLTRALPPHAGLDGFPLDRVLEIHVAGGVITRRGNRAFYADDHTQPVREEVLELAAAVIPRCPSLAAVTFEGDGHPPALARRTLERLRPLVPERGGTVAAPQPTPRVGGDPGARAWDVYDRAHGRAPSPDPEGARADLDYRLAVLAQLLDREVPLTRLLTAGTREGLAAFGASGELRGHLEGVQRTLSAAFLAWARRRLRERPDAGLEVVVAFETWILTGRHVGGGALAPGVSLVRFPADLTEVLFAARALRRHLGGRALASELLETSGLDGVAQAARRAPLNDFHAALVRRDGRTEIVALDADLAAVLHAAARGVAAAGPAASRAIELGLLRG